jgi:ribulose kinase
MRSSAASNAKKFTDLRKKTLKGLGGRMSPTLSITKIEEPIDIASVLRIV